MVFWMHPVVLIYTWKYRFSLNFRVLLRTLSLMWAVIIFGSFISGSVMIFGLLQMRNNFLPFNDLASLLTFKILPFLNTTQTWHRNSEVDSARPPAVVASFSFKQFHMWCCKLTLNEIGMRESLGINIYCCVNTSLLDEVRDF